MHAHRFTHYKLKKALCCLTVRIGKKKSTKMEIFRCHYVVLTIVIFGLSCQWTFSSSIERPAVCNNTRPKACSDPESNSSHVRMFFFRQDIGRCKPFGMCNDTDHNCSDPNVNCFATIEACHEACPSLCPPLDPIENGVIDDTSALVKTYLCREGYRLNGSSNRSCLADGSWSGEAPSCVQEFTAPPGNDSSNGEQLAREKYCSAPPAIDKQSGLHYSRPDQWWLPGTVVTYLCQENYTIYGNPNRTCLPDGTWSGIEPVCFRLIITYGDRDVTKSKCQVDVGTLRVSFNCRMEPSFPETAEPRWEAKRQTELPYGAREQWIDDRTEFQLFFDRISTEVDYSDTYVCQVGNFMQEVELKVVKNVDEGPSTNPPTDILPIQYRSNSSHFTLRCTVIGCAVTITWYQNNMLFEGTEETLTASELAMSYLILEQKPENSGAFYCRGENKDGTVTSSPYNVTVPDRRRRSLASSTSSCSERSDLVTIVAKVRRTVRTSQRLSNARVQVKKVLQDSITPLHLKHNSLLTVNALHSGMLPRLQRDSTYIMKGVVLDNRLFIVEDESVHAHTRELENKLRSSLC